MITGVMGCQTTPHNGQVLASRSSSINFGGYNSSPTSSSVEVQAQRTSDGVWVTFDTASVSSTEVTYDTLSGYPWSVNSPVPAWAWHFGFEGSQAKVRSLLDGAPLYTFDTPAWMSLSCLNSATTHAEKYACVSSESGVVTVTTPGYRELEDPPSPDPSDPVTSCTSNGSFSRVCRVQAPGGAVYGHNIVYTRTIVGLASGASYEFVSGCRRDDEMQAGAQGPSGVPTACRVVNPKVGRCIAGEIFDPGYTVIDCDPLTYP